VAAAEILGRSGVGFGVIGSSEVCCGESIRKAGDESLFRRLAKDNIKTFVENGVRRILVSSPHCYEAFKKDYAEFMVNFEVVHISEYLLELIEEGRLELTREYRRRVTYHDPCYLGRHNGLYDQPRELLGRIPGLELVEMPDTAEDALCCGGGGGGIWMDTPKGERLSDLRLAQAQATGASVLATFCPYCVVNFEDSRLGLKAGSAIDIMDVSEIIHEVI
jgi:Fe-S oxidoreductase